MGFEEALMRIKEGWSVGRKVWGEGKVIRLQNGKYAIEGNEGTNRFKWNRRRDE